MRKADEPGARLAPCGVCLDVACTEHVLTCGLGCRWGVCQTCAEVRNRHASNPLWRTRLPWPRMQLPRLTCARSSNPTDGVLRRSRRPDLDRSHQVARGPPFASPIHHSAPSNLHRSYTPRCRAAYRPLCVSTLPLGFAGRLGPCVTAALPRCFCPPQAELFRAVCAAPAAASADDLLSTVRGLIDEPRRADVGVTGPWVRLVSAISSVPLRRVVQAGARAS